MVCPEEDGNEGQPHDAGRVHREPDVFCLVEVFRNFPAEQKNKESVAVSLSKITVQVNVKVRLRQPLFGGGNLCSLLIFQYFLLFPQKTIRQSL